MSRKPNRNNPSNPAGRSQGAAPAEMLPVVPADDHVDLSGLTFRQQAALPVIASSPSLSQAARNAGIDENTLRRWLREPLFADRLAAFRQQSAVIAREELNALARRGMAVFAQAMSDPDPAIRVRAARYALSYSVQFAEIQNLAASVEEMQRLLSQAKLDRNVGK